MVAKSESAKFSTNQINGERYVIPEMAGDKEGIDSFLSDHTGKPVVVVQGLGFVGGVMSIVCANALNEEYAVIGTDLATPESYWKIRSINAGVMPLQSSDPKVQQYFDQAQQKGNLYATFDNYAYEHADVVIVDVNLDVQKKLSDDAELVDFGVDMQPFSNAIQAIAENCKPEVLLLVETTVPPGTCEKIVAPIFSRELAARGLSTKKFRLGHSYERVMPGPDYIDSIQNFYRVYAGVDEESAVATEAFLKTIIRTDEYPLTRLARTNATEMAKVLENSYRAMNIAFMVEWSRFAEEAGVDLYEVVHAIRMRATHSNMMLPGIGVGGYCLTKDPLLASWSRKELFEAETGLGQSEQGVRINDRMPLFAYRFLAESLKPLKLKGLSVLLLGVSYRGDVGDTRYSPVELFCNLLKKSECEVRAHDYFVDYWIECDMAVEKNLSTVLQEEYDVIAITAGHSAYRKNAEVKAFLKDSKRCVVYDTIGLLSEKEVAEYREMHDVVILGRGDGRGAHS